MSIIICSADCMARREYQPLSNKGKNKNKKPATWWENNFKRQDTHALMTCLSIP